MLFGFKTIPYVSGRFHTLSPLHADCKGLSEKILRYTRIYLFGYINNSDTDSIIEKMSEDLLKTRGKSYKPKPNITKFHIIKIVLYRSYISRL